MNVSSDGITTLTNTSADGNVTTVDLTAVTESTIGHEGHILLTGEDGQTYPVSVSGMITVPAMYQAVVANISQIQGQNDASVQVPRLMMKREDCWSLSLSCFFNDPCE